MFPGSILDRSRIDPGSIQDRSRIDPGSIQDRSWVDVRNDFETLTEQATFLISLATLRNVETLARNHPFLKQGVRRILYYSTVKTLLKKFVISGEGLKVS